jgi:lipoprotein signal peptidase
LGLSNEAGVCLGVGSSNLPDLFVHGGVVDYIFWHYGFEFAIFNLADALIDCSLMDHMATCQNPKNHCLSQTLRL